MINEFASSFFEPDKHPSVVEWCEENLFLKGTTDYPGKYSTSITPYAREILETFGDDDVTDVTLCFGSQTGKTLTMTAGMSYLVKFSEAPIMFILHSTDFARSFSKTRWQPMVNDCPALKEEMPDSDDNYTLLEQHFTKSTVYFVGSNSPGNLSSRSIKCLLCDEVDKYPSATVKEARALDLAIQRTKAFYGAKRFFTSTPTIPEADIWTLFLEGDQRYFFIPSPHTGEYFKMEWNGLKWDQTAKDEQGNWDMDRVKASAYYECPFTKKPISDSQKIAALREGEWRSTNPNAPKGKRSYHLSSLYAPWRSSSFGELAVRFLVEKASPAGLRGFVNGYLAEPWEDKDVIQEIALPTGDYDSMNPPMEHKRRFLTVDVQKDHLWAVVRGWNTESRSELIYHGKLEGFDELYLLMQKYDIKPFQTLIDSGFRTQEVYKFCADHQCFATKGTDKEYFLWANDKKKEGKVYSKIEFINAYIGEKGGKGRTARRILIATPSAKDILFRLFSPDKSSEDETELVDDKYGHWTVPHNVEKRYVDSMNAEKPVKVRNARTGQTKREWREVKRNLNHLFDCEVLQVAAASMFDVL